MLNVQQIKDILKEKIPEGLIVAQHNERGHFYRYTPTGAVFPSVTTKCNILDAPHLKVWSARLAVEHFAAHFSESRDIEKLKHEAILVHQDQFKEAGDIGTRGHDVIDEYLKQWMRDGKRPSDIRDVVRDMIHKNVDGDKYDDPRVFAIARSAELFCYEWNVIPLASEMRVASLRHKFAGTLDALMMVLHVKQKGDDSCEKQMAFDGSTGRDHDFLQTSTSRPNNVRCLNCGLTGEYEFALVDWKTSNSIDKVEYAMQTSTYWQGLFETAGLRTKRIYIVRLDKTKAKYEVRVLTNRSAAFRAFLQTSKVYDWLNDGHEKLVLANPRERVSLDDLQLDPLWIQNSHLKSTLP